MNQEKIIKYIKAFVIPMAIMLLIGAVLLINNQLLSFVNNLSVIKDNSITLGNTEKNLESNLISSIPQSEDIKKVFSQETPKASANYIPSTDARDQSIEKYFPNLYTDDKLDLDMGINIHWAAREPVDCDYIMEEIFYTGNVKYAREEFNWNLIENKEGMRDYSRYDYIIDRYDQNDVNVLGLLAYSAEWASTAPANIESGKEFYPPDMEKWKSFVRETVKRYHGEVYAWEIWNEPNDNYFFRGTDDQYFNLLKEASIIIKEINPQAKVINGGTTWPDANYAQNFYNKGIANYIDGYGVHAYYCEQAINDGNYEKLMGDLLKVIEVSQKYNKNIWITESGCSEYGLTQKEQADQLADKIYLYKSSPFIENVFWYSLRDTNHEGKEGKFGLMTSDYELKQSWTAWNYFNE